MSDMFKNYPQPEDYIPNNRPKHCKPFKLTIMAGEVAEHSFEVPFNVEESCDYVEILYKLGITNIITKRTNDPEAHVEQIVTERGTTLIKCTLTSDETKLLANTVLDTRAQLKFYMKEDNLISYSEIYPVEVEDALDAIEEDKPIPPVPPVPPTPGPGIITGIGYTED